ncbi:NAD-dependent deacetylase [Dyadobacter jejuensis]|uniref:NAD-dependent protein deacylase n=1 Tax=Dyadobacter jejuensis TaxID=1082580 RepID=A0A316APH3_9BACT|nr:NAD-dependent deacylase [Dyadobacter jejuensis]PWJ59034.1 NAD-dependent deacetylase [Dyadobacter jejuensis]
MKKLIVLTGAGISAESGISTFRDQNGLWENHRIEEVATPEAWAKDPEKVLKFYNQRRKQALEVAPNAAHRALTDLERDYDLAVITQNIDNLHERAGTSRVLHLHGEIFKARSTQDPRLVYELDGWELKLGDCCALGSQLRPHIVWFGEEVPMMDQAIDLVQQAELFVIVGTSLAVYPAAGLVQYVDPSVPIYVIDPRQPNLRPTPNMKFILENASTGLQTLRKLINL